MRCRRFTLALLAVVAAGGCAGDAKKVHDATDAARSWAATVKVVAEQWAQSRVSLRFTRTTLETATADLRRQAGSIRAADPVAAARIDRLEAAIDPVMAAVVANEPDRARAAAAALPSFAAPQPVQASARPR